MAIVTDEMRGQAAEDVGVAFRKFLRANHLGHLADQFAQQLDARTRNPNAPIVFRNNFGEAKK